MAWAEGVVLDNPTGNGIPFAGLYNYIDGYWTASNIGWWATTVAFPGMDLKASAGGHITKTVQLYDTWTTIRLDRTPSDGDSGGGGGGW